MPEAKVITLETLSAARRRTIGNLKRPLMDLVQRFSGFRDKVKDSAPKYGAEFAAIKADAAAMDPPVSFGLADFARLFDPSVPSHPAEKNGIQGYRVHKVYYTLDYMQRSLRVKSKGR